MFAKIYLSVSLLAIFHLINPRNSLLISLLKLENPLSPEFSGKGCFFQGYIVCANIRKNFRKVAKKQ